MSWFSVVLLSTVLWLKATSYLMALGAGGLAGVLTWGHSIWFQSDNS